MTRPAMHPLKIVVAALVAFVATHAGPEAADYNGLTTLMTKGQTRTGTVWLLVTVRGTLDSGVALITDLSCEHGSFLLCCAVRGGFLYCGGRASTVAFPGSTPCQKEDQHQRHKHPHPPHILRHHDCSPLLSAEIRLCA